MKNGNESRMNLQLYQGGLNKTYIPTLKDICISNIYSLNWDFLFGTAHNFLTKINNRKPYTIYKKVCGMLLYSKIFYKERSKYLPRNSRNVQGDRNS
jgi:hypothetical protein